MERNITESPDKWVLVKIENNNIIYYKVFGSWTGGYLDSDRWQMNSGVASIEEDEDYYYFNGYSGSCYQCHKKGYGVAGQYCKSVLQTLLNKGGVEVMDENTNWLGLKY